MIPVSLEPLINHIATSQTRVKNPVVLKLKHGPAVPVTLFEYLKIMIPKDCRSCRPVATIYRPKASKYAREVDREARESGGVDLRVRPGLSVVLSDRRKRIC